MDIEEIEFAILEGGLNAVCEDVMEHYGGKYNISFTIEKVVKGRMS